jgi:hypothetical protein
MSRRPQRRSEDRGRRWESRRRAAGTDPAFAFFTNPAVDARFRLATRPAAPADDARGCDPVLGRPRLRIRVPTDRGAHSCRASSEAMATSRTKLRGVGRQ